ncbi:C4-dicarboxylate ABC transporter [Endozoicomonas sp. (ex Bugula neritina AB1)]|nr:C4-dicarboxylate ABC transporter [Endozoicomonas sp. (ex Bugula neritina AB1)]
MSWLQKVPTPLGGLALGIASLGAIWGFVLPEWEEAFLLLPKFISAPLLALILCKFLVKPSLLMDDLRHPVVGSVLPTCTMAAMVVAQSLLGNLPEFARSLWLVAVFAHLGLLAGFMFHRWRDFSAGIFTYEQMIPSWFIPPIGIIVAAVSSVGMGYEFLVSVLFTFGVVSYAVELPLMLYRILFRERMVDAVLPTFAVMGAPASLSMAGYLTISDAPDPVLLVLLVPLALCMTGIVYVAFIRLLRLPFSPGYAAFTFPLVIGSTALFKLSGYLDSVNYQDAAILFDRLAWGELIISSVMVSYVAVRYCWYYSHSLMAARRLTYMS